MRRKPSEVKRAEGPPGVLLGDDVIERVLQFARRHLEMDVAWISHVTGNTQVIESLDGDGPAFGVAVGSDPGYELSALVVAGALPSVLTHVHTDPRTRELPAPRRMNIGAYIGVPLRMADGTLYGMLCCLNRAANYALRDRDAQFLTLVADLLIPSITERDRLRHRHAALGARIQSVLDAGGPRMVYQPIRSLAQGTVVGYEALARFPAGHGTPDQWFADAAEVGLGRELELAAIGTALRALDRIPCHQFIGVNTSPDTAGSSALAALVTAHDPTRIIIEITEHSQISDYRALRQATDELRESGTRIAIDDAGAGYAGFAHLFEFCPDIIKLDYQLTHHIDTDPARIAMATAIVGFARATRATVLAEGIETDAEQRAATALGITLGQGYRLGRPAALPSVQSAGRTGVGRGELQPSR